MGIQPTRTRWLLWTIPATLLAGIVLLAWTHEHPRQTIAPVAVAAQSSANASISAMGRIEPREPVTRVGAAYINGHPGIVAELKVAEGDTVSAGQIIATLEGRPQLEAAVHSGEARVALGEVKLDQVKAAPRPSEVIAQQAEIARWQSAFDNAKAEYLRYEQLHGRLDVSTSELDAKRAEMENARRMSEEARARLAGLSEVRPEDVRLAESELQVNRADLERSRQELSAAIVRSPEAGVVLHVRARKGEEVGSQGIVELAKTSEMCVIAEVYETDIGRVKLGQKAEISSELLPGRLEGTVAAIGREIGRGDVISADPASFADSRVVRVRIQLTDGASVSGLIHGKVTVVIRP